MRNKEWRDDQDTKIKYIKLTVNEKTRIKSTISVRQEDQEGLQEPPTAFMAYDFRGWGVAELHEILWNNAGFHWDMMIDIQFYNKFDHR